MFLLGGAPRSWQFNSTFFFIINVLILMIEDFFLFIFQLLYVKLILYGEGNFSIHDVKWRDICIFGRRSCSLYHIVIHWCVFRMDWMFPSSKLCFYRLFFGWNAILESLILIRVSKVSVETTLFPWGVLLHLENLMT